MVKKIEYILIDDIDGSPAQETVRFSVGGDHYEIELNEVHLEQFNRSLEKWISHARSVPPVQPLRPPAPVAAGRTNGKRTNDGALIRRWAAEHGIEVAARGRIPASLRQRYYAESADADLARNIDVS